MRTALLAGLWLAGCGNPSGQSRSVPPGFEGLSAPAGNPPLVVETVATRALPVPELPAVGPALVALKNASEEARGRLQVAGTLAIKEGRLEIAQPGGDPVEVRFRLPKGLPEARVKMQKASAEIVERSTAKAAHRFVAVHDADKIAMAEVWRSGASPVEAELPGGLRLVQSPATSKSGEGYKLAPVVLARGNRTWPLAAGETTEVTTPSGPLAIHVEASHFLAGPDDDQGAGEYTLHAWITGQ